MHLVRRQQRLLIHLAVLAMVMLVLWPTVLRLVAWTQAQPSYLSVLCSTALKASPSGLTTTPTPEAPPAHAALDHCPLCALANAAPLPVASHAALLLTLQQAAPAAAAAPLVRSAQKLSHHPRGPPHTLA